MNRRNIFIKGKKILSLLLAFVLLLQPQILAYAGEDVVMLEDGGLSDGTDTVPDMDGILSEPITPMPEEATPTPEATTPMPEATTPMPEEATPTPEPTVAVSPTLIPEILFPSDGSLAGHTMRFIDVGWEENSLGEIWAVFDGGTLERTELCMSSHGNGVYTTTIPAGDYSTVTFQMISGKNQAEAFVVDGAETAMPSMEWETLAGPWNYYGQEEVGENVVEFAPETMDTFYYNRKDSSGFWGAQQIEKPVYPSDGSLAGETLKFVNLYWETNDMGSVEAVFDGGKQEPCVQVMNRGDRGVYETVIPEGDYSGVSFRYEGSAEAFASYNIYGNTSDEKEKVISFIPEQNNTFYYDLGETPSYWGADPDYEALSPQEPVKLLKEEETYSVNALVDEIEERAEGAVSKAPETVAAVPEPGNPLPGQMVYFIDMYGAEKAAAGEEIPETEPGDPYGEIVRVNISFLIKNHAEPPHLSGAEPTEDGEAYTMYEKREGVYTAPFPSNVNKYSEIAFQTVGRDSQSVVDLEKHYNFRNVSAGSTGKWGHFNYIAGNADAFFLNRSQRESHWGGHPSVADESLDTKVLYIDVSDKTNNGILADVDNLWIKWANMQEGTQEQIDAGEYNSEKGYKAVKTTTEENVRYFQFPYNSRATENTVLTITFNLTGKTTDTNEYTFRMMYVDRGGRNCLFLDNIWEFNGQMFGKFEVDPDPGEMRKVFFSNTDTRFKKIEMRTSTAENSWISSRWKSITQVPESSEFYKEELYTADVDRRQKYVQFKGTTADGKVYYSNREKISEAFSYPCYYASITGPSSEREPDKNVDNPGVTGYWRSVHSVDTAGDESVNIPEGTFQEEENVYYAKTEFYDYYSDWEMSGRKIKDWNAKDEYEYNKQARTFNEAAEKYYRSETESWTEEQKKKFQALYLVNNVEYNYENPFENGEIYWQGGGNWNKWTGKGLGPRTGLTGNVLENGVICTPDGVPIPFFNEEFLRGNNNLETAVGNVYKNVLFPFTKDTNPQSRTYGYWTFDSNRAKDAMRLSYDVDEGYFLQRTENPIAYYQGVNSFFPFNSAEDFRNPGNVSSERSKVDELFGTRFEIDFRLTENAEIYNESKGKSEAIKFEFQGDDDTWIYVDGILALDLGGIHDAVRGEINFKDGTYTIWRAIKEDGNGYDGPGTLVAEEAPLDPALKEKLKDRNSQHTLTIFYMERGLYESNLKVSFNFPRQNKFSVEKEVDVTSNRVQDEEDIFAGLLENMGAFPFELKNLVTSGGSLPVENSSGYIKPGESKPVYDETVTPVFSFADGAGTVKPGNGKYIIEQTGNISGAVPNENALLKVALKNPMDVSQMRYLRMEMKNTGANDTSASNLYLSFVDGNGNRVGGYAGAMGYDGENNSFVTGEETVIRVDFRQMTGDSNFSWSNVKYMLVGIRKLYEKADASYEISSIEFMGKASSNPTQGFAVEDSRISDYGSYKNGTLTPVDKAWYMKKTRTGDTYNAGVSRATDNGEFSLADNQMAVFTDKFRTGSYLSLTEKNVNPKVFDTTWTVKENGQEIEGNYLLSTRDDMLTIVNPVHILTGNGYPLSNFKGTRSDRDVTVYDGRKELISPEWNNRNFQEPDLTTTLVYRGYRDPDSSSNEATDIKVEVKNTLKRGSLTITKQLAESMQDGTGKYIPGDYTFDIYYTDIAGMGLESQIMPDEQNQRYVRQTVTVHVDETGKGQKTVYNIPAGTMYRIVERPSNGATLIDIKPGEIIDHEKVEILGVKEAPDGKKDYSQAYVQGVAYTGNQEFIFTNENKPFYMDIAKVWKDGLTDVEREELFGISEVYIQLQRRIIKEGMEAEADWETVTSDYFDNVFTENGKSYIKLTKENGWKTTSKIPLPVLNEETGEAYEYRIQEIGSNGKLNYYEVSYEEEENLESAPGDTEKKYLHITYKAVNASAGLQIKKEWDDRDDIAGIRPDKIRVKLMASSDWTEENQESASWVCYKSLSEENHKCGEGCYLELIKDNAWEKTITRLPVRNGEGKRYYYRVAEEEMLYSGENGEQWIKIENDPYSYKEEYGKPQLPNIRNTTVLSVKNSLPLGNITISKKDEQTGKDLSGAEFKLERLITEENKEDFELKTDTRFSPRTGTTSETGMLYFQNLPYGKYKITEIKAPDGYVILREPIYVTVDDEAFQKQAEEHEGDKTYNAAKKTITVTVKNSKFLELPGSGGKGTFMFTLAGVAMIGAALLLYRKKLKSVKKTGSLKK